MSLSIAYWVIMLIWLLVGAAWNWPGNNAGPYGPIGNMLLLFILFLIIGVHDFGAPIHG